MKILNFIFFLTFFSIMCLGSAFAQEGTDTPQIFALDKVESWKILLKNNEEHFKKKQEEEKKYRAVIDFEKDLGLYQTTSGSVFIDIYNKTGKKVSFKIKKYTVLNQPIYTINGILVNNKELRPIKETDEKIRNTADMSWIDFNVLPEGDGIEIDYNKNIDMFFKISEETIKKNKPIELVIKKEDDDEESQEAINFKWESTYRGAAPATYLQDIEYEIKKADKCNIKEYQLSWYLQILKSFKMSGYSIPETNSFEGALLLKINSLLKEKISKEELYLLLKSKSGIKNILNKNYVLKIDYNEIVKKFIDKVKEFFIEKKETDRDSYVNFYLKSGNFEDVKNFLDSELERYNYFRGEDFKEARKILREYFKNISEALLRQVNKNEGNNNLRDDYEKLFLKFKFYIKELDNSNKDILTLENTQDFSKLQLLRLMFNYIVFGDILLVDISSEADVVYPQDFICPITEDAFAIDSLNDFMQKFNLDLFPMAFLGQYKPDIFVKPWQTMMKKLSVKEYLKFPAVIEDDNQGGNVLFLNRNIMDSIRKDYLSKDENIKQGAKLWANVFVGSAVLRSLGLKNEKLSVLMLFYVLKQFSDKDIDDMFTYMMSSQLRQHLLLENRNFGKLDLKILSSQNRVKDIGENIDNLVVEILESYLVYYDSFDYKIRQYFEDFNRELKDYL